jgi:hypothetical protein
VYRYFKISYIRIFINVKNIKEVYYNYFKEINNNIKKNKKSKKILYYNYSLSLILLI